MYESFYLRAVAADAPLGVWIRHTVHKAPGHSPLGAVWFTLFDARSGRPSMQKLSARDLSVPAGGWIAVGGDASMGPAGAEGNCGPARWSLAVSSPAPELHHLSPHLLYRGPLPRTKLTSPTPAATFDGTIELEGRPSIDVRGWRGMVGHNWGSEHAERWIWLHGIGFAEDPDAWIDVALGRLLIGGRLTPWVANGAIHCDGARHRLGGLLAHGLQVSETPAGCALALPGADGLSVRAHASVPSEAAAGWRYADPDGSEHHVVNCSVSALTLDLQLPSGARRSLSSEHSCVYELGMREQDHGVPLAPFADG
jgi:hypothetical protein